MPISPWVPVIVTVILGLAGLGIQALLLAYFIGKMKQQQTGQEALVKVFQDFTEKAISALTERLANLDKFATSSQADRAALNARLQAVERNTDGLQNLRETFSGHAAAFLAFKENAEAHQGKVDRELNGIHRQLANIAMGRVGEVVSLTGGEG